MFHFSYLIKIDYSKQLISINYLFHIQNILEINSG